MEVTRSYIEQLLDNFNPHDLPVPWREVFSTVVGATNGPHFLVGGVITRTILNLAYPDWDPLPVKNYDFATAGLLPANPRLPSGWTLSSNLHGNWKLVKGDLHVDVWPFQSWFATCAPQTLAAAMERLPLNIQAVAYDLRHGQIHYHQDYVQALVDRCVRVLYEPEHIAHCQIAGVTTAQELAYRAKRFDLTFSLD